MTRPTSQSVPVAWQSPLHGWKSAPEMASVSSSMVVNKAGAYDPKAAGIRRAAYTCFAKHGYHGTTVDLICAEAGISKGAFYWHYDSKQAVFLAILDAWADEAEREVTAQFESALASSDPYAEIAVALKREAKRGRAILPVWLEIMAHAGRNAEMRAAIAHFHRRLREVIANLLMPSLMPAFGEAEVRVLAETILSAFIGLVGQRLGDPDHAGFDSAIDQVLAILKRFSPTRQA